MKDVVIEERNQELVEQMNAGATFDPQYVPEFVCSNIVQRALSYLLGWNYITGQPVKIACNTDGSIRTTLSFASASYNDTKAGNAPDAYAGIILFDNVVSTVDFWIYDFAAIIKRSVDGVLFQDEIEIPANTFYSFEAQTLGFDIKNAVALSVARYQVVGWY